MMTKCTCGAWNTFSRVHLSYCKAEGPAPAGWPYLIAKGSATADTLTRAQIEWLWDEAMAGRGTNRIAKACETIFELGATTEATIEARKLLAAEWNARHQEP